MNILSLIHKYIEFLGFSKNYSPHTQRAYFNDLMQVFQLKNSRSYEELKGQNSPSDISQISLTRLPDKKKQVFEKLIRSSLREMGNLSPRTRKRKISALRRFLDWAQKHEKVQFDIVLDESFPVAQKIPRFVSMDECISILHFLNKNQSKDPQLKSLFYLLYGCGMRVSEACQVRWDQITFSQRQLKVRGKGGKHRLVILPSEVARWLKDQPRYGDFVFGEKPLSTRTAYEKIRKLGVASGLVRPLNPHALRHSFATHLLSGGSDLRVLQQLLGHQSLAATELYTHLDRDHIARTMEEHHPLSKNTKSGNQDT